MFTRCSLYCPVCKSEFDWMRGYGREIRCCSKECHSEAEWRRTTAIMGKEYEPMQPVNTKMEIKSDSGPAWGIEMRTDQNR